jgi:hypothetical protein
MPIAAPIPALTPLEIPDEDDVLFSMCVFAVGLAEVLAEVDEVEVVDVSDCETVLELEGGMAVNAN